MKWLLFLISFFVFRFALAQSSDSTIVFSGYILDEDSVPVENAYLINYRTVRGCTTDKEGHFSLKVQIGDSLKITHVSYGQKVIYADNRPDTCNVFILSFEPYTLNIVPVKYKDVESEYFHRNMARIYAEMKVPASDPRYQRGNDYNPYSTEGQGAGFGIDLLELSRFFKGEK